MGEKENATSRTIFENDKYVMKEIVPFRTVDLEPAEQWAEEAEPIVKATDSPEITLTLTPEAASALVEALNPALEEVGRKLKELAEWCAKVIKGVVAGVTKTWDAFMDGMLYAACDNPKHWHLYKHAKKYRTRKKYKRLLTRKMLQRWRESATK